MPSLEQIRHETLAAAVERAQRSWLLRFFDVSPQSIAARVERMNGAVIEFRLKKVELDGSELVGRDRSGAPLVIPLTDVRSVSLRRLRLGRTLGVWLPVMGASAVTAGATLPPPVITSVVGGGIFGILLGFFTTAILESWNLMSGWDLVYDQGGTNG